MIAAPTLRPAQRPTRDKTVPSRSVPSNGTQLQTRIVIPAAIVAWLVAASPVASQVRVSGTPTSGDSVSRDSTPPCCAIVRIDSSRSVVTGRELATGFTFTFEVKARRTLRTLKVGNAIWADFTRKTVTLNAREVRPCCAILPQP